MSMPSSSIARIANGRTCIASVPAENASKRLPPSCRSRPSAIWLRAELCVHTKSTRRLVFESGKPVSANADLLLMRYHDDVSRDGEQEKQVLGWLERC